MGQPKILILSAKFDSGDAITALNLFSEFNKENLFCASLNFGNYTQNFASCYRMGKEEVRYMFPFSFIYGLSGSCEYFTYTNFQSTIYKDRLLQKAYKKILMPILQYIGLYGDRMKIHISERFVNWVNHISPDYIYTSIGSLEMSRFVKELMFTFPQVRFIIHGYDDWLEPNYKMAFRKHFRNRSEKIFTQIIDRASLLFATSDKMADDYLKRYGKTFITFPNPVKISGVEQRTIKNSVLFIGKVGKHNLKSILLMAKALNQFNARQVNRMTFDLYSNVETSLQNKLKKICKDCIFHNWINHEDIPIVIAESKILFLPISISKSVEKFTRYSMSTKMSEFLSSGRPVIYCGPKNIAMTEVLMKNGCAFVVTNNDVKAIVDSLQKIKRDDAYVDELVERAKLVSQQNFDLEEVSTSFKNTLCGHYENNYNC